MSRRPDLPTGICGAYSGFVAVSLAAIICVALLAVSHSDYFAPYFGKLDPVFAIVVVAAAGFGALGYLQSHGWFAISAPGNMAPRLSVAAGVATVLALPAIGADLVLGFPKDINVPLPQALLFYPAMAYVVEVVFHVVPITLLLVVLSGLFRQVDANPLVWGCLLATSLIEPVFQVVLAGSDGSTPTGLVLFVGVHLLVFNLVQVYLFRRFDFITMLSFRFVYYLHWHILWGYARLAWF